MESRIRKPSFKFMHVILNQCVRGRMAQAMFAVFLHSTLRVFVYVLGISMTGASLSDGGTASPVALLFALLLLLLACLAGELLSYGLYSVLAPLVRNRAASIKGLFAGFGRGKSRVVKAALLFTAINAVVVLVLGGLSALMKDQLAALGKGAVMMLTAAAFVLLVALLTLPFTFVYLILLTKEDTGVGEAFVVSWRLLMGQLGRFIAFVAYSCGKDLVMVVVIQLLLFVLPRGEDAGLLFQLLATLASFMGVLAEYRAMTRGYMAVCIYFFSEAGILRPHGGPEAVPSSPEAVSSSPEAVSSGPEAVPGGTGGEAAVPPQIPEAEDRAGEAGGTDE